MAIEHRSVIWVTELGANRAFDVRTLRGVANESGEDPDAAVASNLKDGRPLVYTIEIADGYDAAVEIQKRNGEQVSFNDTIEIEGRKYRVQPSPGGDEVELVPQ